MRRNLLGLLVGTLGLMSVAACGPVQEPVASAHRPAPEPPCGSTDEQCCLTPIGAPDGALLAVCTPGLVCSVVPGTGTTAARCLLMPADPYHH